MNVVGISAYYHESACCLLINGQVAAAVSEERLSRRKHDPSLPVAAFRSSLEAANIPIHNLDVVAYYEDPIKKLARQLWTGVGEQTWRSTAWLDPARPIREIREILGFEGDIRTFDHHLSHAASAYYYSGFEKAAIWTIDGVGEWTTTSYGIGEGSDIHLFEEVSFPDSLGLLYATVTAYLGFKVNSDEYKVMGLAPYGRPRFLEEMRELCFVRTEGRFSLVSKYFDFRSTLRSFTGELLKLLGQPERKPGSPLTEFHRDVACSVQRHLEEILSAKARYLADRTNLRRVCMAGGVALNSVAIGVLRRTGLFDDIFVQPAAGDAGACLGAAALASLQKGVRVSRRRLNTTAYGPRFAEDDIESALANLGMRYEDYRGKEDDLVTNVAKRIAEGEVVAWFHGRMEFGPRALGGRSILADARDPEIRARLNAIVKKREAFRPFAPAVLSTRAPDYFDIHWDSPFMTEVCQVLHSKGIPAVTHIDGSARPQTVDDQASPRFAKLLRSLCHQTGMPIVVNTSFNVRGEPIVCTPRDALLSFARSGIDTLVLESLVLERRQLPPELLLELEATARREDARSSIRHEVYTLV